MRSFSVPAMHLSKFVILCIFSALVSPCLHYTAQNKRKQYTLRRIHGQSAESLYAKMQVNRQNTSRYEENNTKKTGCIFCILSEIKQFFCEK
ncbi:MAG TPA: hypothetical protein DCG49_10475 [Ruminococcus sp.]|nr:hypothetical protein [Ruminococcus sp.]